MNHKHWRIACEVTRAGDTDGLLNIEDSIGRHVVSIESQPRPDNNGRDAELCEEWHELHTVGNAQLVVAAAAIQSHAISQQKVSKSQATAGWL